jgi:uncharacterized protein involved in exopolysaccharide biosynthesis
LQTNIVTLEQVRSKKSFLTQQLLTLKTDETLRAALEQVTPGGQQVGSLNPLGQLQEQRQRLQQSMQAEIRQVEIQEQRLVQEQEDIRQQMPVYEQKITHAVLREQELAVLTRDYESTRKNYEALLAGHMQAKSAENLERRQKSEQFRVLDPASLPLKPWQPNRLSLLLLGLAVGLAVGGGTVYLAEYLDRSFRDPEDLKQISGLPVLATIPLVLTAAAQRRQRLHQWSFYAVCMIIPMTAMVAVYFFWGKSAEIAARIIPFFKL